MLKQYPSLISLGSFTHQDAKVPKPDIAHLKLALPSCPGRSEATTHDKYLRTLEYKANRWFEHSRRFRVKGIRLDKLQQRPKNTLAMLEEAHRKMELAKDAPADACSGLWYDEDGNLLAAAFAQRAETTEKPSFLVSRKSLANANLIFNQEHSQYPYYSGPAGRTMDDINQIESSKVHYDGILVCYYSLSFFFSDWIPPAQLPGAYSPSITVSPL